MECCSRGFAFDDLVEPQMLKKGHPGRARGGDSADSLPTRSVPTLAVPQQWDELFHQWEFTDKYTLVPFLEINRFGENLLDVACIFPLTSSSCTECSITLSQGRRNVFMNLFGNE